MNETYGLFKKFSSDNHYTSLTKAINSAVTTKETAATLKRISKLNGHGGYLVINDGICYSTFLHITNINGNDSEYNPYIELTMAIFSLERVSADDFDADKDVEYRVLGKMGVDHLGHRAISNFKCNSMLVSGDIIYLCYCFQTEDGDFRMFRSIYHIADGTIDSDVEMKLSYKGKLYYLSDDTVNIIYLDNGMPRCEKSLPEMVSHWSEYKGEYYATFVIGSPQPNNGMIVKTKDFENVEFVSLIPGNENGSAEVSSYIKDGYLYLACRQKWGTPYLLFMKYDLENQAWCDTYKIEDGNARPWFFEYKDELYLFNTIEERKRRYANISKILTKNASHSRLITPVDTVATIFDCGAYLCFDVYEDRIYFICTKNSATHFGELKLKQCSNDTVNNRLIELFGDL